MKHLPRLGATLSLVGSLQAVAATSEETLALLDAQGRALANNPCTTPISRKTRLVVNHREPTIRDEVLVVRCSHIESETYHAKYFQPARVLPVSLRVTSAFTRVSLPLQVGASTQEVEKTLGKPESREGSALTYPLSQERPDQDTISFSHAFGRVTAITWVWSVD